MKEKDQVKSNSMVFEYLGIISFIATVFMCSMSYWLFKILFTEEYFSAYIIAPYLFLAPLLQMLFQVACNQFLVVKKTWPNMIILLSGAIGNVVLNYLLIPVLGIEGASIATLVGYIISDIICVLVLIKMKLMVISKRFIFASLCMIVYFIDWRLLINNNAILGILFAIMLTGLYVFLYRKDLRILFERKKETKA